MDKKQVIRRFYDERMTKKFAELCDKLGIATETVWGMDWNMADKVTTEPIDNKLKTKLNLKWSELTLEVTNV
jgi:hypothetical protein